MTLHISQSVLKELCRHAVGELPDECCGILMGRRSGGDGTVHRAVPAENIAESDRRNSYQIDWETLFAALRSARLEGTEIIGFYHSHPDGSITPSQRDRESVWIGCSHVIVSLTDGGCRAITSCQLPYARAPFQQEPILVSRSTHTGYKPRRYIMLRLS